MRKGIYTNLLGKSYLMVKKKTPEHFPLKISNNERMSNVLTSIQHYTEGPDHYYKAGKKK